MKTTRWVLIVSIWLVALLSWADPVPDLAPLAVQIPAVISAPPNPSVQVVCGVTNRGDGEASGYWNDALYLSTNEFISAGAQILTYQYPPGAIEPGETYWFTNQFTLPMIQQGRYYLIISCDVFNSLQESNRSNNQLAVPFDFKPTPPDLAPISLVVNSNITAPPNPAVSVAWCVTNAGTGYASGYWLDAFFISSSPTFDEQATMVTSSSEWGPVNAGGSYWRTNTIQLPLTRSGTYYLFLDVDHWRSLFDSQTNNNLAVAKITFTSQQPDLAPAALLAPSSLTSTPKPNIPLVWGVTNQGVGAALGAWEDKVYLSTNETLEWWDTQIIDRYAYGPVGPGETYWLTNDVYVPVVDSGTYYLIFQTDAPGGLYESDTNNNILAVPISITIQRPDLAPLTRFPSEIIGPPYPSVDLIWGATNRGVGAALGSWIDSIFLATNAPAGNLGAQFNLWRYGPVAAGEAYWQTNTIRLPIVRDGIYYFTAVSDQYSYLYESDRSNNAVTVPVVVHILPPDLAPVALQTSATVTSTPNPQLTFVWGITNQGRGAAVGYYSWYDSLYCSTNPVWDSTATRVNLLYESGPTDPGGAYWRTNVVRVPVVASGRYYFFLKANENNNLLETDYSNNDIATAVNLVIQPPDLSPVVSGVLNSFVGPPNPYLTLSWGVTNKGAGQAQTDWGDAIYLSSDTNYDDMDVILSSNWGGPLAPKATFWHTNLVRVPVTQSGVYYLIFIADRWNYLIETDETNNMAVVPVAFTVLPPDLAPVAFDVPTEITGPPNPSVSISWGVTNQGIGPAQNGTSWWSDTVYFSKNTQLEWDDRPINSFMESGPIEAGGSYWRTNTLRIPVVASTNGYLIFKTDSSDAVYESNETNNTVVVPVHMNIQLPDLAPLVLLVPHSITSPPNPTVTFVWAVTNQGPGLIEERAYYWPWYDYLRISTNSNVDTTARLVGNWSETSSLPAGGTYWRTNTCTLPVIQSGAYYLNFTTDASRTLYESDFSNNSVTVPVNFTIQPADLAPVVLQAPATLTAPPRPDVVVAWGVTNQGLGSALGYWQDTLYLSPTPDFGPSTFALLNSYQTGPVEAQGIYWQTNSITLPVTQSGTYYLMFRADNGNSLFEDVTNNNWITTPMSIQILPPDLAAIALNVTNY
ncbi:MAG TPA: CARDB domain-containing protein, partial [Verrucomicrobiae bacterium]|nr:CARDB domain-containing protein [Verrucomicrobiae bacterium]